MTETVWTTVARVDEVPEGEALRVMVDETPVAVFNVEGDFYAIGDICSHEEASLAEGEVDDTCVECPRHGARFDLRTGRALSLPATHPVPAFDILVENGEIKLSRRG